MQIVVPNAVMRSALPAPRGDDAGRLLRARSRRRCRGWRGSRGPYRRPVAADEYEPLWAVAMAKPNASTTGAGTPGGRIACRAEGHPRWWSTGAFPWADPFSFAGLVSINGDSARQLRRFSRGARVLQAAMRAAPEPAGSRSTRRSSEMNGGRSPLVRAVGIQLSLTLPIRSASCGGR